MTGPGDPDTDQLLQRLDRSAREQLFARYRLRLREAIALRLDRRVAGRVDPSDVVQDTLVEADRRLSAYLRDRPLPFYPWLRQLALERVIEVHRRHIRAGKRSVGREERSLPPAADESAAALAERLFARGSGPGSRLQRRELGARVRTALARLPERDRELLVLRHLEQMPTADIAAVVGVSEGAVKMRHLRALERLRALLEALGEGDA